jgi:hypothetical protein
MRHFNIRYECNNVRDDYSSLEKEKRRAMPLFGGRGPNDEEGVEYEGDMGEWGELFEEDLSNSIVKGPNQLAKEKLMMQAE